MLAEEHPTPVDAPGVVGKGGNAGTAFATSPPSASGLLGRGGAPIDIQLVSASWRVHHSRSRCVIGSCFDATPAASATTATRCVVVAVVVGGGGGGVAAVAVALRVKQKIRGKQIDR